MQNFIALLFLFLLFGGCDSPQLPPSPSAASIELVFQELSPETMERFFQYFEINDTLKPWYEKEDFMEMSVKNNNYELLCLSLSKIGESLVYRPDVIIKYQIEDDSLRVMYSDIRCFFQVDSVVCLKKGQSAMVYFEGRCADQNSAYEYNFIFYADSAGQGINPQFMQFPCGVDLPKKKM